MKSLTNFFILSLLGFSAYPKGIRVYYKDLKHRNLAQKALFRLEDKGIPPSLLLSKKSPTPCAPKASVSFIDFCLDKNGELQKVRETPLASKSLRIFFTIKEEK